MRPSKYHIYTHSSTLTSKSYVSFYYKWKICRVVQVSFKSPLKVLPPPSFTFYFDSKLYALDLFSFWFPQLHSHFLLYFYFTTFYWKFVWFEVEFSRFISFNVSTSNWSSCHLFHRHKKLYGFICLIGQAPLPFDRFSLISGLISPQGPAKFLWHYILIVIFFSSILYPGV